MKLTHEQIEAGITPNGGYRLSQLIALGYRPKRPGQYPEKGWKDRLTKREVTPEQYAEFLRLSNFTPKQLKRLNQANRTQKEQPSLFTTQ